MPKSIDFPQVVGRIAEIDQCVTVVPVWLARRTTGGERSVAEAIELLPHGLAEAARTDGMLAETVRAETVPGETGPGETGPGETGPGEVGPGDIGPSARGKRQVRPPRHLADLDPAERRAAVAELGQPGYRADQLSRHYFGRLTDDPADMTDLPAGVRSELGGALLPPLLTAQRELECDGGTTRKTLWRAFDGAFVESVLMRYPDRVTMCVSSQAGCGMACPFCATGQSGLTRNLSAAEIVTQVFAGARAMAAGAVPGGPGRVSNVVFMGMGEPLANYRSVLAAVRRITEPAPAGLGISQRSVTVSTVGLVPAIRRLAAEGLSVRLAVSLHAPDDELRDELVPVNRRWKVAEVLDAAWDYAAATGRRVSIEYAMIRDINDHAWRADRLASLLAGRLAHVNLIPLNPTPGSKWTASDPSVAAEFLDRIAARGVPITVRDTRGTQIDGACGQLAASTVPG
jgi:23S rRNA (adenine2503-C2)-methyltransferase